MPRLALLSLALGCAVPLGVLAGCSARPPAPSPAEAREALMAADRAFAAQTADRGLDGWMDAYAPDAVRLSMGGTVAQGTEAVRAFDAALFADPTQRLVWAPTDAGSFSDGRHGFTTGRSALLSARGDTLYTGVYVTLWRREADGRWRAILDTGAADE